MNTHSIRITGDGSTTIFNSLKNEHYHSTHGAVQESMHVFIQAGIRYLIDEESHQAMGNTVVNRSQHDMMKYGKLQHGYTLNVLEVGFGTGLNALLTLMELNRINNTTEHRQHPLHINYTALEPFPIDADIANKLNYCEMLSVPDLQETFERMHSLFGQTDSSHPVIASTPLSPYFNFTGLRTTLQDHAPVDMNIAEKHRNQHLVYFDAFSPDTEPTLWTKEVFSKLYAMMNRGGVLVTYCSKGVVRRTMQECGFRVERLKGPPGKHEMLRGLTG
jgi:tRNA U34 5-methylaminomethyl-2-thiouridine-forming methyltransferase MnmC